MRKQPQRETDAYARLSTLGVYGSQKSRPLIKATPSNLRRFSNTPYARRAINAVKNPIAMLEWEVRPIKGVKLNSTLQKQIDIVTACLKSPNNDDSDRTLREQVLEDILVAGAGTIEQQVGGDASRPLWMWPVDSMSIQIYAAWSGDKSEARYKQVIGNGSIGLQQGKDLRNDELIYIRPDVNTASPYSYGPLETAFNTISRLLGVAEYAGNVATNAQPGFLLYLGDVDQAGVESFRRYWRDDVEGQGQTPITGGKLTPEVLRMHGGGDEALYLKYQAFVIRELAAAFGISPLTLGLEGDVNRNTAEVTDEKDWNLTIKPLARLYASHITREAIHSLLGYSQLEFAFLGLDLDDEKNLAEVYEIEYRNNAITPDEYREARGRAPLKNMWGSMVKADADIATKAAQGAAVVDDPNLPPAKATAKPKGKD
ncbi:MAG: phage portal protein [Xanthobacteraceae bacterium]